MLFSKVTILEGFQQRSSLLFKEGNGDSYRTISEYREYLLDKSLLPKDTTGLEGDWEITVSFRPKGSST